jgi:hypothetical protein
MNQTRIIAFWGFVLIVTVVTLAYLWQAILPAPAAHSSSAASMPLPTTAASGAAEPERARDGTSGAGRLFSINYSDPPVVGRLQISPLAAPAEEGLITPLSCERVHYAADVGICLLAQLGTWLTPMVSVTLFNEHFEPIYTQRVEGYASRTRVSPDGRYAAYTVFVSGHSYADANFSTATHILEVATGADLGDLESYEVWRDGKIIREIDFNFWGVTFARDSNRFYATLSTGGVPSLVEGNIAARRMTVLHDGVECPSLSPDNQRIAFKKNRGNFAWQLAVLDLNTMQETLLPDPNTVDDQAEWLDNETILYEQMSYDTDRNAWINLMQIAADGSSAPTIFVEKAGSPAVVH